jgi:MFS family permease
LSSPPAAEVAAAQRWPALRALRHANFRLYGAGLAVSLIGTWMQSTAQAWLVYRLTRSNLWLGGIQFAATVPILFLSPIAGVIADRYPRRSIILLTQSLFLLQAVALALLTLTGHVTIAHLVALAAFFGLVNAFDIPARQSLLPELVGPADLLYAIALNSMAFQLARVFGPALGGFTVAAWGEGICFALNAASFAAVIAGLLLLKLPRPEQNEATAPAWQRLKAGFAYVRQSRDLLSLLGLSAAVNIFVSPIFVLGPEIADGIFHRGPRGFGILTSAFGAGAVLGMLGLVSRKSDQGLGRLILWSTFGAAAGLIAFAFAREFWMALALMPIIGFCYMRQNAATNTSVQQAVPGELRGRLMGIYTMTVAGMIPIGSLLSGWCAEVWGAPATLLAGGAGQLAAAIWFGARHR